MGGSIKENRRLILGCLDATAYGKKACASSCDPSITFHVSRSVIQPRYPQRISPEPPRLRFPSGSFGLIFAASEEINPRVIASGSHSFARIQSAESGRQMGEETTAPDLSGAKSAKSHMQK